MEGKRSMILLIFKSPFSNEQVSLFGKRIFFIKKFQTSLVPSIDIYFNEIIRF